VAEARQRPAAVGLLGGGVIGGGWAARFALHGTHVRLFDPDPRAGEVVEAMVGNARRALGRLLAAPLPPEGRVDVVATVEEAVDGAELVQESAPEREGLKRELLAAADRAAAPGTLIASSTSGLLPTRLAADLRHPERFCVGHPFNPVYLLPLVEVCGGQRTDPGTLERASAVYRSVGMRPLLVRTEIDGFLADRLLEALWREALWLVHDGVATTEEVDDAIRFGAGLRWAAMGTFLTYRIAGGEAGMRHFLAQFGPALQLPWTRLTDVPELTEELLDRVVAQSDAQAAGRSVRELERLRDDCLVAVLHGLRDVGVGAGAVLAEHERLLLEAEGLPQPLRLHAAVVPAGWIDYNGHAHESRYLQVAGDATDALLDHLGIDADYRAARGSFFTVETHLSHLGQAREGERVEVATQLLAADDKRVHLFHALHRAGDGALLATAEQMLLHVDAESGRAGPAGDEVLTRLRAIAATHARLPRPERAGRAVGAR
jgi:carnitine 3-dehydrogenase